MLAYVRNSDDVTFKAGETALFLLSTWMYMCFACYCALATRLQLPNQVRTQADRDGTQHYNSPIGLYAFAPIVLDCENEVPYPKDAAGNGRKCRNPECVELVDKGSRGLCPRSQWKQTYGQWPAVRPSGVATAFQTWGKQSDQMLEFISFVRTALDVQQNGHYFFRLVKKHPDLC